MQKRILSTLLLASTVSLTACAGGSPNAAQVPATGGEAPMAATPAQPAQPDLAPIAQPAPKVDQIVGEATKSEGNVQNVTSPAVNAGNAAATPTTAAPAAQVPLELTGMKYDKEDTIVFQSVRPASEGAYDLFVYKADEGTILAIPGVNTAANEMNPRVSDNGKWLVFQRAVAAIGGGVQQDIYLYNLENHLLNNLQGLNTTTNNEYMPDVSDDGKKIVFIRSGLGPIAPGNTPEVHLYDVKTGDDWTVPGANANMPNGEVHWPTLSANGSKIAYSATPLAGIAPATDGITPTGGSAFATVTPPLPSARIYVYKVDGFKQITPPFINEGFTSSYNPDLSSDGDKMLFVSNRLGSEQIYEVDFRTGQLDNLQFANVNLADNQHPRYIGDDCDKILFQVKAALPVGVVFPIELRAYDRETGLLDLLPIVNTIGTSNALRAPQTELLP